MANIPRRNLGGDSEPWGRTVDERLLNLRGAVDLLEQSSKNTYKGINASLSGVSRSLSAVQDAQEELAEQQVRLDSLVASLSGHQIRGGGGEITGSIPTTPMTVADLEIGLPNQHNYGTFLVTNNGSFLADSSNGYLVVGTEFYVDGVYVGAFSEAYLYNSAFQQCAVSNTYQLGRNFEYGGTARIVVKVYKTDPATVFSTKRLNTSMSLFTYER